MSESNSGNYKSHSESNSFDIEPYESCYKINQNIDRSCTFSNTSPKELADIKRKKERNQSMSCFMADKHGKTDDGMVRTAAGDKKSFV